MSDKSKQESDKARANFFRKVVANAAIAMVTLGVLIFAVSGVAAAYAGTENKPLYRGSSKDKVSLMVNVYWGTEYIDGMLATLDKHEVKTTFFVGGTWAKENEGVLKKIAAAGHEIGNHGYFHKDHSKMGVERNREEISATHSLVKTILNLEMTLFAPPSGAFNDATLEAAAGLGYTSIMWTRDTIDWRDHDPALIKKRAVKNTSGGDLILMHPTNATAQVLEDIIVGLKDKGITVATVSEVIGGA